MVVSGWRRFIPALASVDGPFGRTRPTTTPYPYIGPDRKKAIMTRFDLTFSGSAELVTGVLLAALVVAMIFV
jgi:hypothetical protein